MLDVRFMNDDGGDGGDVDGDVMNDLSTSKHDITSLN